MDKDIKKDTGEIDFGCPNCGANSGECDCTFGDWYNSNSD